MLKALELVGFKSFADKTRFEFPPGITVVVGPNGSGKSNIVDAIKWVLGEQSAKSLRGKDMADVIFKGAGSGTRKVMNAAEATLVIDNSEHRLPIDAPEVHITRRVYRSGEGEYLINRQPCRLKDIRDLCRGTGVGTDAYSLIEQGKVDRLLQASPRDRRAIFEEAAGISRFKAKKIEAQRRLERVDQNLLRLSDIVDEVESRLRTVRAQAGKAQRYREYSDRLQQLRTQVGMTDWRGLSDQLRALETDLEQWRQESLELTEHAETLEVQSSEVESAVEAAAEEIRHCDAQLAENREQIAARQSAIDHQRSRCRDLEDEAATHRGQLAAMTGRAGDLQQRLREVVEALEKAESSHEEIRRQLVDHERALQDATRQLSGLRTENEARRAEYLNRMRSLASLSNQVSNYQSQLAGLRETASRCRSRWQQLQGDLEVQGEQLAEQQQVQQRLDSAGREKAGQLENAQTELDEARRALTRRQEELSQLQGRLSGVTQRASVLEDLERRLEGLSAGVKQVLAESRDSEGPFRQVRGLVASLLQADMEIAPLVDVALGPMAQHVVLVGDELVERLRQNEDFDLPGRVGLVRLDAPAASSVAQAELDGKPGVVGRADRLVEAADPEMAPLVQRLLGTTWFVEKLAHALALSAAEGAAQRFVTMDGELLEGDGTLVIGPLHSGLGLVSRRSELRALHEVIEQLRVRIDLAHRDVGQWQADIERHEQNVRQLTGEYRQLSDQLGDHRIQVRTLEERFQQLQQQCETLEAERRASDVQAEGCEQQLADTRQQLTELEQSVVEMERAIQREDERIGQLEERRQLHGRDATAAKVELAKSEQQLSSLRAQRAQYEEHQLERTRAISLARGQLQQCLDKFQQSERDILAATSELAELYLYKEAYARQAQRQRQHREQLHARRGEIAGELTKLRTQLRRLEEKQHKQELAAGEIRHQRQTLAERLRDDYGIDISGAQDSQDEEETRQREQVEDEIADLRRKINNIGAVNMDALEELDDLEARYETLSGQFQDLTQAKEALQRIIGKINADSRRLFLETLEIIRANFQTLYRKAFGGGKADLVLEEGADVLECGVDIVTTPPGKAQFSNSLLSGGEKALTAVALLMAIFQYRPSPFCVLDEVDAPFDEANIGRFVDVLKDFLEWTRFVIVTHSKKTMTAATTLYGVTMQESGVSKQVSVRFEDVSDDGQISQAALQREVARQQSEPLETDADSSDDERAA